MVPDERKRERRWLHMFSLLSMPAVFGFLYFFTGLNPIYCLSAGLLVGGVAAVVCRPDLVWNTLVGGLLFMSLYFVLFALIVAVFPSFVDAWNLSAISGILVVGVPLEELMFAFTFGMMWSSVYEHVRYYAIRKAN